MPAQNSHCQPSGPQNPISTDRTTFTNSSSVAPCHSLQIESGFLVSTDHGQQGYDAPESIIRYGATNKTELRLVAPDYFQSCSSNGRFVTGPGDLGIGVKQQLAATKNGFNLAAIGALTFPTGATATSSHGYDPTLQLMPSKSLMSNLTLGGMLSVAWPTQNGRRNATGQSSAQLDWQFVKPADAVIEYSSDFPQRGSPQHYIDLGGLYRPTPRQQIDVRAGFGLSGAATDRFFGAGYSVRFDF